MERGQFGQVADLGLDGVVDPDALAEPGPAVDDPVADRGDLPAWPAASATVRMARVAAAPGSEASQGDRRSGRPAAGRPARRGRSWPRQSTSPVDGDLGASVVEEGELQAAGAGVEDEDAQRVAPWSESRSGQAAVVDGDGAVLGLDQDGLGHPDEQAGADDAGDVEDRPLQGGGVGDRADLAVEDRVAVVGEEGRAVRGRGG